MDDKKLESRTPRKSVDPLAGKTPAERRAEYQKILDLFGKLDWDPTYDYKAERGRD
jgi:hypothetical protein